MIIHFIYKNFFQINEIHKKQKNHRFMSQLVELKPVCREDVKRISNWLRDSEVSEAWFGRYTYGNPAHLGYEPEIMITASQAEWNEVFNDPHHEPHRDIFSIYKIIGDKHIGEGQLSIDEALGDAQISVLLGDKNEWYKGYGTASSLAMLEHIFINLKLYRAWVDIPEYNITAKTMFENLGFIHEGTLRKSRPHGGARHNSYILGMLFDEFKEKFPHGIDNHVVEWKKNI
tara:strand:- start:610 stop:1299 length:690 start_codon:yes stop_codon:yes gene_type:complete